MVAIVQDKITALDESIFKKVSPQPTLFTISVILEVFLLIYRVGVCHLAFPSKPPNERRVVDIVLLLERLPILGKGKTQVLQFHRRVKTFQTIIDRFDFIHTLSRP